MVAEFVASQVRHTDAVSTGAGKIALEVVEPAGPPGTREAWALRATAAKPQPQFAEHCDVCRRPSADVVLACPDCRDKATYFNSFQDDAANAREDTRRLNVLEQDRNLLLAAIIGDEHSGVREIIDRWMETTAAERGAQ